jgi:hypothetical protein
MPRGYEDVRGSALVQGIYGRLTALESLEGALQTPGASVLDLIPDALHAAIANGTNTTDLTPYFATALLSAAPVFVPPGTYLMNLTVTGAAKHIIGAGREKTVLRPFAGNAPVLTYADATSCDLRDVTLNTIGSNALQFTENANCQGNTHTNVNYAGDTIGPHSQTRGDTLTIINPFVYCTKRTSGQGETYWLRIVKDANPSVAPRFAGNNNTIFGGALYGGGAGYGGCGVRVDQDNTGGGVDLTVNRPEGVKITSFRFISDGTWNISINNSLSVWVENCICDQSTSSAIVIGPGAEDWKVQGGYCGSVPPRVGKTGILVQPGARGGSIIGVSFFNLQNGIDVQASSSLRIADIAVIGCRFRFIDGIEMRMDSPGSAVIVGNVSGGGGTTSGGSLATYRSNAQPCYYMLSANAFSNVPAAAYDGTSIYKGGGNVNAYTFLDQKSTLYTLANAPGPSGQLNPATTAYMSQGGLGSAENQVWQRCEYPFTVDLLTAETNNGPGNAGTGNTVGFTFLKNGVATALTATLSEVNNYAQDTTHSVSLAPGDYWSVRMVSSANANPVIPRFSMRCNVIL